MELPRPAGGERSNSQLSAATETGRTINNYSFKMFPKGTATLLNNASESECVCWGLLLTHPGSSLSRRGRSDLWSAQCYARRRYIICWKVWLFHFYPQDSALWRGTGVHSRQVPVEAGDTAGRVSTAHTQQTSGLTNTHHALPHSHTHTHTHRWVLMSVGANTCHMCFVLCGAVCSRCSGIPRCAQSPAWIGSTRCNCGQQSGGVHVK